MTDRLETNIGSSHGQESVRLQFRMRSAGLFVDKRCGLWRIDVCCAIDIGRR